MVVKTDVVWAIPHAGEAITVEELIRLPDDGNKYERVKGVLKV